MAPMNSIPHDTGAVSTYNLVSPMLHALDEAERALWPAGRVLCPDHGTFAEMALLTAAMEDEGRYVVPVACGVCGGWTIEAEPPKPATPPVRTFPALRPLFAYITMRTRGDVGYCTPANLERAMTADVMPWFIALLRPGGVELWTRSFDGRLATLIETCEVVR